MGRYDPTAGAIRDVETRAALRRAIEERLRYLDERLTSPWGDDETQRERSRLGKFAYGRSMSGTRPDDARYLELEPEAG